MPSAMFGSEQRVEPFDDFQFDTGCFERLDQGTHEVPAVDAQLLDTHRCGYLGRHLKRSACLAFVFRPLLPDFRSLLNRSRAAKLAAQWHLHVQSLAQARTLLGMTRTSA